MLVRCVVDHTHTRMTVPKENMLSGKILRRMNIETRTGVARSYLRGQLSRSTDAPKGFGSILLNIAFDQLAVAKDAVGFKWCVWIAMMS